jgi:membrane protein implicated in regulation of membrane protease activity
MSPWLWATAALVVAFVELVAPGMYLVWIALGAAVTAGVTGAFAPALEGQLLVFAAASLASCSGSSSIARSPGSARTIPPSISARSI